ncbi:conserved hypothetical protein [Methanosalsum zhilinae DSM 4017]|uniref:TIGR00341 family protein n=1 Tax=Methanosalsum zhilinae (strain DSM 4017 / NBRC 107636 / OCM 62 / WeN5) TaxID=679901 RepID=F7XK59_METZD|nr:TIGR00341 family protein [Methanosalsum zhilinae]AEH60524.1 conserved hypothetical protein [Methanosalsum zhilinae DSM 4017]
MATKLLELILPAEKHERVKELLENKNHLGAWFSTLEDEKILVRIVARAENSQEIIDELTHWFSVTEGFRIIIHSIDATIPRPEEPENNEELAEGKSDENTKKEVRYGSITREELYEEVSISTKITSEYYVLVILSTIVAVIGVLENSVAIIIGAMVIAPLLGPNISLSLATTLADFQLGLKSLKVDLIGISIAIIISFFAGMFAFVDPTITEISTRTEVNFGYVILGLAAGGAGALSITTGVSAAIVGVMVAVALLPPLVVFGLLLGAGYINLAFGAMLLFLVNIIAINLSGVITFYAQGVRPSNWWDIAEAKKTTTYAMITWVMMLFALILLIYISQS